MNAERYVLITGASKGIGRAAALQLAKGSFHVFAGVRNPADGEALQQAAGNHLTPIQIDVTHPEQITQAVEQIIKTVGLAGLYGLVNNAGIAVAAPMEFIPIDEFRHQIEVNLVSQLAVTQAFVPLLRQAHGRIINITSVGGRIAGGMLGAYHASKFALEALTDTMRQELSPWGIEVIAVEPGAIATPIWATSIAAADRLIQKMAPEVKTLYSPRIDRAIADARNSSVKGIAPERVAETIDRALTTQRPGTRYTVGTDAYIGVHILSRLPDRLRDRLMASLG